MNCIYLDTETVPAENPKLVKRLLEKVKNKEYNSAWKPETVAARREKDLVEAEQNLIKIRSLNPGMAQVVCLCAETDDGITFEEVGPLESNILTKFESWLAKEAFIGSQIVTYNGRRFDIHVLCSAYMRLNMALPGVLKAALTEPYKFQVDLCPMFPQTTGYGGLQILAEALGLEPMEGTGADVFEWYKAESWGPILMHCRDDVRLVKEIHQRMS